MATIRQLKKYTSSLQSMMYMNAADEFKPEVGMYLTRFMYTDRYSKPIIKVDGEKFYTEEGEYIYRNGKIKRFWTTIEFIGSKPDFSNSKELHAAYVENGGTYNEHTCYIQDVISGVTKLVKRWEVLKDYRITPSDLSYLDPSF